MSATRHMGANAYRTQSSRVESIRDHCFRDEATIVNRGISPGQQLNNGCSVSDESITHNAVCGHDM